MWNAIRMDVYRMFHMRSFWVMAVLVLAVTYLTTTLTKTNLTAAENGTEAYFGQGETERETKGVSLLVTEQEEQEEAGFGIHVNSSHFDAEDVTVGALFHENFSSMFCSLFMVIFAVLFTSADMNSGYIKNIGGQVSHRSILILSKSVSLFLYTIVFMLYFFVVQAVSCALIFGYLKWGAWKELLPFLGMELLLQFAFLIICMTITMVIRSKVFGMTAAVCLCMGVSSTICMLLDKLAKQYLNLEVTLENYLVTTKIGNILPGFTANQAREAILVAAAFLVVMTVANVISTEKRDLV